MVKLVPLTPEASVLETLMPGVYLSLSMALAVGALGHARAPVVGRW